ncbi:MAG: twin-arginine translocase TatA/TatE family subunit [Ignavibacteria bacterium]|nr:twin-arginine translocase TatA/TatE family subunit [Ignavibacteria bacterium]
MPSLGTTEIILILLVVVLLFGAKKIPELMRGLGTGIREFKKSASVDEPNNSDTNDTPKS